MHGPFEELINRHGEKTGRPSLDEEIATSNEEDAMKTAAVGTLWAVSGTAMTLALSPLIIGKDERVHVEATESSAEHTAEAVQSVINNVSDGVEVAGGIFFATLAAEALWIRIRAKRRLRELRAEQPEAS